MITPLDIQNKEFKRAFRGYKDLEVDEFLDEIVEDYEKLYKENIELKDKILTLNEQIEYYNNLENTLKETLVVAQNTADDVVIAAREKSKNIIKDAELMAREIIIKAEKKVEEIKEEYEYLQREVFLFKTRYKSFLEAQITTIDEFYSSVETTSIDKNNSHKDLNQASGTDNHENLKEEEEKEERDDLGA